MARSGLLQTLHLDRPPSNGDVVATVLGSLQVGLTLSTTESVAWAALAAGGLVPLVVGAVVTLSDTLRSFRERVPTLGRTGGVADILTAAVIVGLLALSDLLAASPLGSFGMGVILCAALLVGIRLAATRR